MNNAIVFDNNRDNRSSLIQEPKKISGLSSMVRKLVESYRRDWLASQPKAGVAAIHVDDIASKVALFYEKIRRIIDWKEEHLVRRGAIERILKRRMISEISGLRLTPNLNAKEITEPLILELIRGGHFPNDRIPQTKVAEVEKVLNKYIYIFHNNPKFKNNGSQIKEKINFYHWIMEIAACEIEETVSPAIKENALLNFMTNLMVERIQVSPVDAISNEDKKIQTYIAVHRALFHLDAPIISYHLLKYRYSQWINPSPFFLEEVAKNIFLIWKELEKDLHHPLSGEFYKICEKYDTPYLILGDVLESFSKEFNVVAEKISQPSILENSIREIYNQRLSTLKSRLFRTAIYSTLSIFIANGFSFFIVEVPVARLFYGGFSFLATLVDFSLPTALMFILVTMIKPPPKSNLEKVIEEIKKIVYQAEVVDVYQIKVRSKRWSILRFIVGFLYFLVSCFSFALVVWIFYLVRIPTSTVILDTMNVAMIVFAALVIKQRAKELTVEEKTSFWEFSLDIISVPVARIGQWLSSKWKEYNIVSVFFAALIDMPFLTFIKFIEGWSVFLKEKKSEIH